MSISDGSSWTMEYNANEEGEIADDDPDGRLIMEMFICAPWGNYEYEMVVKSSNGGDDMQKVSWEIEYGPPEVREPAQTKSTGKRRNSEHDLPLDAEVLVIL